MMEINNKNFIVFEDQNVFSKEYKEMKKNLPALLYTEPFSILTALVQPVSNITHKIIKVKNRAVMKRRMEI